jgi:chitin disaccharide deacetylase
MTSARGGARLIVHADDFGLSEAVNRAVIAAHEHGIVTATSLMAGGDAFEHAVSLAKACPTLDVGVHLTLTEQRSVAPAEDVPSLVDAAGTLAPHAIRFAVRYLRGAVALADVRTELDAQIRRVIDYGLAPSHLDGHQHVHVLPGIARVVAELARNYGIRAVRCPAERLRGYMIKDLAGVKDLAGSKDATGIQGLAGTTDSKSGQAPMGSKHRTGRSGLEGAKRIAEQLLLGGLTVLSPLRALRRADRFVGFYFGGRLNEHNLRTVLDHLPPSRTIELMCHPGHDDPASRYGHWNYAWAAETAALSSPRIRELLDSRGVRLIGYRDT